MQGIGCRERQEDSFALLNASNAQEMERQGLFAVVCDGMGGMEDGKSASEGAVEAFLQLFQAVLAEGDVPRQLREGTLSFRTPSTGSAWGTAPFSSSGGTACSNSTGSTPA